MSEDMTGDQLIPEDELANAAFEDLSINARWVKTRIRELTTPPHEQ